MSTQYSSQVLSTTIRNEIIKVGSNVNKITTILNDKLGLSDNTVSNYFVSPVCIIGSDRIEKQVYICKAIIGEFEYVGYLYNNENNLIEGEFINGVYLFNNKLYSTNNTLLCISIESVPNRLMFYNMLSNSPNTSLFYMECEKILEYNNGSLTDITNGEITLNDNKIYKLYDFNMTTNIITSVTNTVNITVKIYNITYSGDRVYYPLVDNEERTDDQGEKHQYVVAFDRIAG